MADYIIRSELSHHGVRGMKWGIRRYQNKDGTLTPAGLKRYNRTTTHEDVTNVSTVRSENRKRVMAKYEHLKNDVQKQADANRNKAYKDYYDYVERYSKSNKDTQVRYEHDFDYTKKGKKLINMIITSDEARRKAYVGAKWYAKYSREMQRAANRDHGF